LQAEQSTILAKGINKLLNKLMLKTIQINAGFITSDKGIYQKLFSTKTTIKSEMIKDKKIKDKKMNGPAPLLSFILLSLLSTLKRNCATPPVL
jgi:hypothetical protein